MKRILLVLCMVLCGLMIITPSVKAHELESSGSIGIVMHFLPFDNVYARPDPPAIFELLFTDTSGNFFLSECNCSFSIWKDGKQEYSHPLTQINDLNESKDKVVFNQVGSYEMKIHGEPKVGEAFVPFDVSFEVQAESDGTSNNKGDVQKSGLNKTGFPWKLMLGLALLVMYAIALDFTVRGKKKTS